MVEKPAKIKFHSKIKAAWNWGIKFEKLFWIVHVHGRNQSLEKTGFNWKEPLTFYVAKRVLDNFSWQQFVQMKSGKKLRPQNTVFFSKTSALNVKAKLKRKIQIPLAKYWKPTSLEGENWSSVFPSILSADSNHRTSTGTGLLCSFHLRVTFNPWNPGNIIQILVTRLHTFWWVLIWRTPLHIKTISLLWSLP